MPTDIRPPVEWAALHNVVVMDPDGWRVDRKSFETPITEDEFLERLSISTIATLRR